MLGLFFVPDAFCLFMLFCLEVKIETAPEGTHVLEIGHFQCIHHLINSVLGIHISTFNLAE